MLLMVAVVVLMLLLVPTIGRLVKRERHRSQERGVRSQGRSNK
jgi:hypothetical protein